MKLGDGKGSKTGNELDNLKDLNKKNSKFKRKIKFLKKKVKQGKEVSEGVDNNEYEDAGDQFGGKHSNKKSKKN